MARVIAIPPEVITALRDADARFALAFGSRARGTERPESDLDSAAYFGEPPPASFDILLPAGVDLLVLNGASLARVADEQPRTNRSLMEYREAIRHGG